MPKEWQDWEKVLMVLFVAQASKEKQKVVIAQLFGWDQERVELAFGEATRRGMVEEEIDS